MYLITNIKNARDGGPQSLALLLTPVSLRAVRAAVDARAALAAQGVSPDVVSVTLPLILSDTRVWGPTIADEFGGQSLLGADDQPHFSAGLLRAMTGLQNTTAILGHVAVVESGVRLGYDDSFSPRAGYEVVFAALADPLMGRAH